MLQVEIQAPNGKTTLLQAPDESIIGKAAQAEIRLEGWRVGKEHARLFTTPSGVLLEDMGAFGGVFVNGERIDIQFGPLKRSDVIGIGPYKLNVSEIGAASGVVQAAHVNSRSDTAAVRNQLATEDLAASRQRAMEAQERAAAAPKTAPAAPHLNREVVLVADPQKKQREFEWRKRVHTSLLETMDLRRHDISGMTDEHLRTETSKLIAQIMDGLGNDLPKQILGNWRGGEKVRVWLGEPVDLSQFYEKGDRLRTHKEIADFLMTKIGELGERDKDFMNFTEEKY